jgi:hypothetical protein
VASDGFPIAGTQFGFTWGPAEVVRVLDDKRFGVLISVQGKRGTVELRVTPGGRVSVHRDSGRKRGK